MNPDLTASALVPLLPELLLGVGAMTLLILGAYRSEEAGRLIDAASVALLVTAGLIVLVLPEGRLVAFNGSFVVDDFARFLKILAMFGSAAAIVMSLDYARREREERFEYSVLILLSTLGMLMLISAADLIALYLGLELMSLPLYVVAASHRSSLRSTEAGLKYFVLGALSSGMLLYGASLVYGFTGTVNFAGIAHSAAEGGPGLIFGLVFLFAGFCFKVSAVPFHMWTPDVYEGAPTPVTAFFAAAPKVAGMAMFVRAAVAAFPGIAGQWQEIVVFVAIASMLLGAFAAIGQRNIKRLMAYSSIGHMGFALIGLAAGTAEGVQGVLVYMAIYVTDDSRRVRRDPVDAAQERNGGIDRPTRRPCPHPSDDGVLPGDAAILDGRRTAARRLLRQVLRVSCRHQGRVLRACGDRGARKRRRRLLLSVDRQGHVFRRAGGRLRRHAR